MKKVVNSLVICFAIAVLLASCVSSDASIQEYYIESKDNKNFLSVDIPASVITLRDNIDPEAAEAYKSLKKLNILAFKKNQTNEADYQIERKKVKQILKGNQYNELIRINDKGRNFIVKYEGDENTESFDEVIVYANDKTKGFALVRVLGDEMTPEKFMKLTNGIKDLDFSNAGIKELSGFLKQNGNISFSNKK